MGHRRERRRGRRIALSVFALLAVLLGALAWAGWQSLQGARQLDAGANRLKAAEGGLLDGDTAASALREAGGEVRSARNHLSDPVVRAFSVVPRLGDPLQSARGLAEATDLAVNDALVPLVDAAGAKPAGRLVKNGAAVDVTYLASLATPSAAAERTLADARRRLAATPVDSGVGRLDEARVELTDRLGTLQRVLDDTALATRIGPDLLGASGVRRYLLISQSPAESRGTGGLVGGYNLLEVNAGKVRVVRGAPRRELKSPGQPVADLGKEFQQHYARFRPTTGWIESNVSPHYPYAAQIWKRLWEKQFPEKLDGVLVLDPVALSYLVDATGPVTLADGTTVDGKGLAALTMSKVYAKISDDLVRDAYLQTVSDAVTVALTTRPPPARALVDALRKAVGERRLLLWSPDAQVEQALSGRTLAGEIPRGPRVVGDVIANFAGSKLDYYLERRLTYTAGCNEVSTVSLRLKNGAPTMGLPDYVTPEQFRVGLPRGTNRVRVNLHVPRESRVFGVTVDGTPIKAWTKGTELDTVWVETYVTLLPGQLKDVQVRFQEPDSHIGAPATRLMQPLVRPEAFSASVC